MLHARPMLNVEQKTQVIKKYRTHETDTGSSEVQIAIISERIAGLSKHFEINVKDHSSRRGLLHLVARRRCLLDYLKLTNREKYSQLIEQLGIRK